MDNRMRNFLNKVWNASRFLLMQFSEVVEEKPGNLQPEDKWILSQMNDLVKEVTDKLDDYEMGLASHKLIEFFWNEFCDWYVEMVKPRLKEDKDDTSVAALWTLKHVLTTCLKLLHPFTPFITETIFLRLQDKEKTIMVSDWPAYDPALNFPAEVKTIRHIQEAVRVIRNIRMEKQVPASKKVKIIVVCESESVATSFTSSRAFFAFLAGAEEVEVQRDASGIPDTAVSVVTEGAVLWLPLDSLIDFEKERARLGKELKKLEAELARVEGKLANDGFIKKAPPKLIEEEEEKRDKYLVMLKKVEEQMNQL